MPWTLIWETVKKIWPYIIVGLAIIALCSYVGWLKYEVGHKEAKIQKQEVEITKLASENQIYKQNAEAAKKANEEMALVRQQMQGFLAIASKIPEEVKKGFRNETVKRVNHCMYLMSTGVPLPPECTGKANVPAGNAPGSK